MRFSTTPTYTLTLPSTKKEIKYRPFVVKEEKNLLISLQENDEQQIYVTLKDVLSNCTFGNVDIDSLPSVDMEYLFLKVRNKSMGEGIEFEVPCQSCGKEDVVFCNLDEATVFNDTNADKTIVVTDELKIAMRYPTAEMMSKVNEDEIQGAIETIAKCIEFIDEKGKLYECDDLPFSEMVEFVENLTQKTLTEIDNFLANMPRLVYDNKYKCKHCGEENIIHLEGLENFFG